MHEIIVVAVVTVLAVCAVDLLAPRVKVAAPVLLVVLGLVIALVPTLPHLEPEPHLILEVILPPLLYAAALQMPAISFRRDIGSISLLSVTLVLVTSLGMGALFAWLIPDLGFPAAVALGAVLAPTDAVAVGVLRGGKVPPRVLTILSGESLLNDATSLVILRTALAAVAVTTTGGATFVQGVGSFLWAVASALAIGWAVARATLWLAGRIESPTVNTTLSFTLPFLASVPTEMIGGSGLVAAVVTGLIIGSRGPRVLGPAHRQSVLQHWASAQLLLEGLVFLLMGLQFSDVIDDLHHESVGIPQGLAYTALALVLILAARAVFVAISLSRIRRRTARGRAMLGRIGELERMLESGGARRRPGSHAAQPGLPVEVPAKHRRFAVRLRRVSADIGYHSRQRLGRAEGVILVWAGMRGAVTVAAAQTFPADLPHRPLLVFIAFTLATVSLLGQGGTVGPLATRLYRGDEGAESAAAEQEEQHERLQDLLAGVVEDEGMPDTPDPDGSLQDLPAGERRRREAEARLPAVRRKRAVLLDARDEGLFDAEVIEQALAELDAIEVALELRLPDTF